MSRPHHPFDGGPAEQRKPLLERPAFLVTVGLIALVTGAIMTLAVTRQPEPAPAQPASLSPVATAPPVAPTPQPTEDPLTQRRPLSDFLSPEEYARFMKAVESGQMQGKVNLGSSKPAQPAQFDLGSSKPAQPPKDEETENPDIPKPEGQGG